MADDETKRKFKELLDVKHQNNISGKNGSYQDSKSGNKTGGSKSHQKQIRRKSG